MEPELHPSNESTYNLTPTEVSHILKASLCSCTFSLTIFLLIGSVHWILWDGIKNSYGRAVCTLTAFGLFQSTFSLVFCAALFLLKTQNVWICHGAVLLLEHARVSGNSMFLVWVFDILRTMQLGTKCIRYERGAKTLFVYFIFVTGLPCLYTFASFMLLDNEWRRLILMLTNGLLLTAAISMAVPSSKELVEKHKVRASMRISGPTNALLRVFIRQTVVLTTESLFYLIDVFLHFSFQDCYLLIHCVLCIVCVITHALLGLWIFLLRRLVTHEIKLRLSKYRACGPLKSPMCLNTCVNLK